MGSRSAILACCQPEAVAALGLSLVSGAEVQEPIQPLAVAPPDAIQRDRHQQAYDYLPPGLGSCPSRLVEN